MQLSKYVRLCPFLMRAEGEANIRGLPMRSVAASVSMLSPNASFKFNPNDVRSIRSPNDSVASLTSRGVPLMYGCA